MDAENITFITTVSGSLLTFLTAAWIKVVRPAAKMLNRHEELTESVNTIKMEITTNAGGSLKDAVCGLSNTCQRIERSQVIIEQRTKASLHYSNIALFETDEKGQLTWTNEPFYKLTGLNSSNIEGFDWLTYIHEDERDEFLQEFESCLSMNRRFLKVSQTSDNKQIRMQGFPYKISEHEHGGFLISISELPTS